MEQMMLLGPLDLGGSLPEWSPPIDFPDLSSAGIIAIDTETKDPLLLEKGPGTKRKDGYIVGVSVGTPDGFRGYFPVRHKLGGNLNPSMVFKWLKRELGRPEQPKVGANLLYDCEWLATEGVEVKGDLIDVQIAEPLINENRRSYSLDNLSKIYLDDSKDEEEMYQWMSRAFGGPPTRREQIKNLWMAPAAVVGKYAEKDVDLPLRIWAKQKKILEKERLMNVFNLETEVLPVVLAMRERGVRVNLSLAEQLYEKLGPVHKAAMENFWKIAGDGVNPRSTAELVPVFDKLGIEYPRTPMGNPSITKPFLKKLTHPIGQAITESKVYEHYQKVFVKGYVLDSHVNGRVYGQFHQLKTDENGTISGRFSSSNPNLENIPGSDKPQPTLVMNGEERKIGAWVRSLFLPDEGEQWISDDYSQIEYRLICHFGRGPSAEVARASYRNDPETDFHGMVVEMTGLERKPAKAINFGKAFGAGVATIAHNMSTSHEIAQQFIDMYEDKLPFVSELLREVSRTAETRGWIKTLSGRRARFDMYERRSRRTPIILPLTEAKSKWGNDIRRAKCYKALNRLIQGSAADIFKASIRNIKRAGIMDVIGCPLNLVHDENCWSVDLNNKEHKEAHDEALHLMKSVTELKVPLLVDSEVGPSWGEVR